VDPYRAWLRVTRCPSAAATFSASITAFRSAATWCRIEYGDAVPPTRRRIASKSLFSLVADR
jgi:hypothetical protein